MSFSKNIYDEESYQQSINQSVGPGSYHLGVPRVSCKPCFPTDPTIMLQGQGVSHIKDTPLVDVSSELYGINRKLSKNINDQYIPSCPDSVCSSGEVCGQGVVGTCANGGHSNNTLEHMSDCSLPTEDTRLTNPPCNLRGTGWNRWQHLHTNPQANVEIPFNWNISNRILVKDNHRACIPTPLDPRQVLPNGGDLPCEQTTSTCAVATLPKSVYG